MAFQSTAQYYRRLTKVTPTSLAGAFRRILGDAICFLESNLTQAFERGARWRRLWQSRQDHHYLEIDASGSEPPGTATPFANTRRLRAAFVCSGDPENVRTWSGTPQHMLHALRREFDIELVVRHPWPTWAQTVRRVLRRLSGGTIDLSWWPAWTRITAASTVSQIVRSKCDVLFAVAVTPICAEVVTRLPTVFVSDATLECMVNYNPRFSTLSPATKRIATSLETRCIQNAVMALFPSEWASRSAISDHGGRSDRVVQVPWGANVQPAEFPLPEQRSSTEWRLLFVGTNWAGKGGSIALQAVADMRRRGHDVHLDIVGSAPPEVLDLEGVTFHGFLDKRDPLQSRQIETLFATAHVFFLPTQFEALGIVFAEAASYGIPSVSYATGGVPAMVKDGVTGVLLPEGAPPSAFADALVALLTDRPRYMAMSYAALSASRDVLNWEAWARRVREELSGRLVVSPGPYR